ncbi:TetR family transcriptional regulator [Streptomyces sp. SID8382]|uniref:TetR/AcrR family transcriptional regulator n=1 Tax=Streptomyces malaysiensis TaxID=92644 RepID=UPI000C2CDC42|nr:MULTISPECIES: TetR/AcrR family transcriptional regulator [unclassified Streptomyces]AUA16530.1 Bacterial regulatory protein, tetR family [Streptomyces sp. M56]MYX57331.1 TetR family transcriptional regulator [Streptomyces sp. SID8382]
MANAAPGTHRLRRVDARSSAERIIAAGRSVLGTGEGSLEQIAAEAGVGIATLYRHFPNREALVRAVLDDILDTDLLPLISDVPASRRPRQSLLDIATRLLDLITEERGLVTFVSNFADVAVDALQRLSDSLRPLLERAQEQGEIRTDLTADDIPRFLVMGIAALALPGTTPSIRARFTVLLFDSLNPANATALPPLLTETEEDDLQTAISNAIRS